MKEKSYYSIQILYSKCVVGTVVFNQKSEMMDWLQPFSRGSSLCNSTQIIATKHFTKKNCNKCSSDISKESIQRNVYFKIGKGKTREIVLQDLKQGE